MNIIKAKITALACSGSITLVTLQTEAQIVLQLLVIDSPKTAPYLQKGTAVRAFFKETEVILACPMANEIAIPNKINARISLLEHDQFLTRVHLETAVGALSALVHAKTLQSMNLGIGDNVVALIKMNEIMLAP